VTAPDVIGFPVSERVTRSATENRFPARGLLGDAERFTAVSFNAALFARV
jgi:hypothetical protein